MDMNLIQICADFYRPACIFLFLMIIIFLFTVSILWRHVQGLLKNLNHIRTKADLSLTLVKKIQHKLRLFQKKKKKPGTTHSLLQNLLLFWSICNTFRGEKKNAKADRKTNRNRYRRDLVNTLLHHANIF